MMENFKLYFMCFAAEVRVKKPKPNGCGRGCYFATQITFEFEFGFGWRFRMRVWVVCNPHPTLLVAIPRYNCIKLISKS